MEKVNLNKIDTKPLEVARKFGYKPLWGLDSKRTYVLLAEKDGREVVIKTSHIDDEVDLLKLLSKNDYLEKNNIITPKVYEYSKDYLIQDFIPGEYLGINSSDFQKNLKITIFKLGYLQQYLNREPEFTKYSKGIDNKYSQKPFRNNRWLKKRVLGWFTDEQSKLKYRFKDDITEKVIDLFEHIEGETIIQFGAFSPAHIRIINGKMGVFDFGRHIRWAPAQYDRAYLWWGLLCEGELKKLDPNFWIELAQAMSNNISQSNKKLYWACIIERLAGMAKDLTVGERYGNNEMAKELINIRDEVLPYAIKKQEE